MRQSSPVDLVSLGWTMVKLSVKMQEDGKWQTLWWSQICPKT